MDVPKAFFRRGEAHLQLKDYELAMNDFQMVIELDPDNKAARNKVAHCLQEIKAQKNRDKKIFANMFDKFARCRCREIFTSAKNFGVVFIPEL
jgi:FK506-binding protein 4/5